LSVSSVLSEHYGVSRDNWTFLNKQNEALKAMFFGLIGSFRRESLHSLCWSPHCLFFFFFKDLFILERAQGKGQREKERENLKRVP